MNTAMRDRLLGLSVKVKLIGVGIAISLIFGASITVAEINYHTLFERATAGASAYRLGPAVADAYEQWTTDDDQSNMYAALAVLGDPKQHALMEDSFKQVQAARAALNGPLADAARFAVTVRERQLVQQIGTQVIEYDRFTQTMRQRALAGDSHGALRTMAIDNASVSDALTKTFESLEQEARTGVTAANDQTERDAAVGSRLTIGFAVVAALAAIALLFAVSLLIARPLQRLAAAASRIAKGDLAVDADLPPAGTDELGALAASFRTMVGHQREMATAAEAIAAGDLQRPVTPQCADDRLAHAFCAMTAALSRFAAAQAEMKHEHDAGDMDAELPAEQFEGAYRTMAEGMNQLVASQIAVTMRVVEAVARYSSNDFSADIDRLPGKQAQISEAVDLVRDQLQEAAAAAVTTARIKAALDNVSTNAMISDENDTIVYLNRSVAEMMRTKERAIQKELPNMHADKLVGSNIAIFHKSAEHQRGLLANLRGTHRAEIELAGFTFHLTANPVVSEDGTRLGTVVEWKDRTAEVAVEQDVNGIVEAAIAGDFSRRLPVDGHEGFFRILAERINALMETSDVGLGEVVRVLSALAKGDLTESIHGDYQGTFGQLKDDSNRTVESLTATISQITQAVDAVSTAAREIAVGNSDLSQRTEEQASSLEETASSMEELTSTVKQNANNAKQANQLAIGASAIAVKGGEVVGQVVSTMASISASSKKIEDIISVIDGIAFQTNILASNT